MAWINDIATTPSVTLFISLIDDNAMLELKVFAWSEETGECHFIDTIEMSIHDLFVSGGDSSWVSSM